MCDTQFEIYYFVDEPELVWGKKKYLDWCFVSVYKVLDMGWKRGGTIYSFTASPKICVPPSHLLRAFFNLWALGIQFKFCICSVVWNEWSHNSISVLASSCSISSSELWDPKTSMMPCTIYIVVNNYFVIFCDNLQVK